MTIIFKKLISSINYIYIGPKDANDALRECPERIQEFLAKAKTLAGSSIVNFEDLRE